MKQTIIIRDERLRDRVLNLIALLNIEKAWSVTIEPYRKRRTPSQMALYWRWLDDVVEHVHEHTGQDKDDIHEWLKARFLTPRRVEIDGDIRQYYSTKKLSTADMSRYIDQIYIWATSELGLFLPLPEELGKIV